MASETSPTDVGLSGSRRRRFAGGGAGSWNLRDGSVAVVLVESRAVETVGEAPPNDDDGGSRVNDIRGSANATRGGVPSDCDGSDSPLRLRLRESPLATICVREIEYDGGCGNDENGRAATEPKASRSVPPFVGRLCAVKRKE